VPGFHEVSRSAAVAADSLNNAALPGLRSSVWLACLGFGTSLTLFLAILTAYTVL
jgi:hypothetical protein